MKRYTTSQRLHQIMQERNIKQVDILNKALPYCEKYNVKMGRNDISQYCSGKVEPKQDKLVVLANALNVTETWLMGYEEETSLPNIENVDIHVELIMLYDQLSAEKQKLVIDMIKNMI